MCTALLLERLWQVHPDASLGLRLPEKPLPPHGLPVPDLAGFARRLSRDRSDQPRHERTPSVCFARCSLTCRPERIGRTCRTWYTNGRDPTRSLTFRLIQELNLGSERFEALYQLAPQLQTESYLSTCDRPMLNPRERGAAVDRVAQACLRHLHQPAILGAGWDQRRPGGPDRIGQRLAWTGCRSSAWEIWGGWRRSEAPRIPTPCSSPRPSMC